MSEAGEHIGLVERLTPREREILRLVDRHLSSKQIARELGIRKDTVDEHLDKARQRLGVASRFEAARLLAASEGPASAPVIVPPGSPIAWGPPPVGVSDDPHQASPDLDVTRTGHDRSFDPTAAGDPERYLAPRRGRPLPPRLAGARRTAAPDAVVQLGGAGAPAGRSRR